MNPILPLNFYMPDGEPRIFGDTLYLYGSHDLYKGNNYCLGELYCAYSKINDLKNFKLKKILTFESSGHSFEEAGSFQAPDCINYNGKYYLYVNRMKSSRCDIAVSDSPLGPFKDYGFVQNKDGSPFDLRFFDPAIFIDDDNRIYLYTGFCPNKESRFANVANPYSQVLELDKDMKTVLKGPYNLIPGPLKASGTSFKDHPFFEASSLRKFNNKYYFIYSSSKSHELAYAISDNPIKGFECKGTLISNANISFNNNLEYELPWGNNHGSIAKINDKYIIFYHRQTTGMETSRQAMAEFIQMDHNGLFSQAEMTTSGLEELHDNVIVNASRCTFIKSDYSNPKLTVGINKVNEIVTILQDDVYENIHYVNIIKDAIIGFKYFNFKNSNILSINVSGKAYLEVKQDLKGDSLCFINITNDKDFYDIPIKPLRGKYPLYFIFKDVSNVKFYDFKLIER